MKLTLWMWVAFMRQRHSVPRFHGCKSQVQIGSNSLKILSQNVMFTLRFYRMNDRDWLPWGPYRYRVPQNGFSCMLRDPASASWQRSTFTQSWKIIFARLWSISSQHYEMAVLNEMAPLRQMNWGEGNWLPRKLPEMEKRGRITTKGESYGGIYKITRFTGRLVKISLIPWERLKILPEDWVYP